MILLDFATLAAAIQLFALHKRASERAVIACGSAGRVAVVRVEVGRNVKVSAAQLDVTQTNTVEVIKHFLFSFFAKAGGLYVPVKFHAVLFLSAFKLIHQLVHFVALIGDHGVSWITGKCLIGVKGKESKQNGDFSFHGSSFLEQELST